jgi:hypothetical protein
MAEFPGADDLGFELLPVDDADIITPEEALNAAAASALEEPEAEDEFVEDAPEPFGVSWAFDFEAGRFVRHGQSPARVSGHEALKQWCLMAAYSARYAHVIFSENFGTERPQGVLGEAGLRAHEAAADFRRNVRDAWMGHDRIADVTLDVEYDPMEGVVWLRNAEAITDEDEAIPFDDIRLDLARED